MAVLALFLSLMSAYDTIGAGVLPKAFLVGRMAFLLVLCTFFLRKSGERWADVGLRRPARLWPVPLIVAAGFIVLLVLNSWIRNSLLPSLGMPLPATNPLQAIRGDLGQYLFYAIAVSWGTAAFGEEMLVRGFILDRIAKLLGPRHRWTTVAAVILQALLFGSFHVHQGARALVAVAAGLVLGFVYLAGGRNLWPGIILHGLVDFVTHTNYYRG